MKTPEPAGAPPHAPGPMRPRAQTSPGISPPAPAAAPNMVPASRVREAVDEAVAPLHRVIEELQTRLADLEKGLLAQPPAASGATQPSAPPGAHFHESAPATFARPAQVLDVAAIERDVHIPIDRALDGRRRQRRVVTTVALLIALTLGSFVVALVYSYASRGDREGSTGSFIGDRVLA